MKVDIDIIHVSCFKMKPGYVTYNAHNKGTYKLVLDKSSGKLFAFKLTWIRLYFPFGHYLLSVKHFLYLKRKEPIYNFY